MATLRILVLFASAHGQTRAIAEALSARLREHGAEVAIYDVEDGLPPAPTGYDVVGFGSRVHGGEHAPAIISYIDRHRAELRARHSFFFSVSLTAAKDPSRDPGDYILGTIHATAWRPELLTAIAGGLPYRRYNPLRRLWMKVRSLRHGDPADTSLNYEFTDWGEVRDFADAIIARAREPLYPRSGQHHDAHDLVT
jgi:menaquinone-dependent protoporphyrinogen oxidase